MDYFPMFVDLRGARCVVVGGGQVAARKIDALRRAQADVVVVAPELCEELSSLAAVAAVRHLARAYLASTLDGARAVVAATDDVAVNRQVSEDARARGVLVNVVDAPSLCTFLMPAVVERGALLVAVSSGGASPVLARTARARIEAWLPPRWGALAELCARLRGDAKALLPDGRARRAFFEELLASPLAESLVQAPPEEADTRARELLRARASAGHAVAGSITLIGCGDGDPDLVSLRALRLLQSADLVVLAGEQCAPIAALARRDARRLSLAALSADAVIAATRADERACVLAAGCPFLGPDAASWRAALLRAGRTALALPVVGHPGEPW